MSINAVVTQGIQTTAKVTPQQNILVTNYQVSTSNITVGDLADVVEGNLQDGFTEIFLIGPAKLVFKGEITSR